MHGPDLEQLQKEWHAGNVYLSAGVGFEPVCRRGILNPDMERDAEKVKPQRCRW